VIPLADSLAVAYAAAGEVEAVAVAGSTAAGSADARSDLDLYVYLEGELSLELRRAVAGPLAERLELDNRSFEPGDEWVDPVSGCRVDVMFRATAWIEEQLDRVLVHHRASLGYTTCLWHNVLHSRPLFDRGGWFGRLKGRADVPYPEALRRAVVAANFPLLRSTLSSFAHQAEVASGRGDRVAVNHRVAALLASFFDVLFALNRQTHPGEKRLLPAVRSCPIVPHRLEAQVERLLRAVTSPPAELRAAVDDLVDGLEPLLDAEGLRSERP
jgi:hypothetical protein